MWSLRDERVMSKNPDIWHEQSAMLQDRPLYCQRRYLVQCKAQCSAECHYASVGILGLSAVVRCASDVYTSSHPTVMAVLPY